jgi:transmembrane 9 superfamily protein 3
MLMLLNVVGLTYGTISTLPVGILFSLFVLWAVISLPLVAAGTYFGRHMGGNTAPPLRVHEVARPLPKGRSLLAQPWVTAMLAGILPFGAIFVEMHFVFTSFWNYKFYYVYGFMLLVMLMLVIVVACVSVVITYMQLNAEDWRWQWHSFLAGASVALYVLLYSAIYFFMKTYMSGILQISYYFGYSLLLCSAIAMTTGSVGYFTSQAFVKAVYSGVKLD